MTIEERARFMAIIDAIDDAVAGRPDVLASPIGFVAGALVGAGRDNPDDAYRQLAGLADVLAYVLAYVKGHPDATVEAIVGALLPAVPA